MGEFAPPDSSSVVSRRVESILKSIDRIRPLPTSVSRIMTALDDPNISAGIISELIGLDQALAANVLQTANSFYLGYGPTCSNLTDAVMRLGFGRIRTIVQSVQVAGSLVRSLPGYRLGSGDLWNHSVATAVVAQWFAKSLSYPNSDNAYVAGLLHDIGKLLLDQFALADYDRMADYVQNFNLAVWQVEQKLFGIDHAGVGGLMAKKWNFPPALVDAIQYHHVPSRGQCDSALAALINLSNALNPLDQGSQSKFEGRQIHPATMEILHLDQAKLNILYQRMLTFYHMNYGGSV